METSWNSLGDTIRGVKYASISTDERSYISQIHKLAEKYPEDVIIKKEPESNDGCMYAWLPAKWFRLQKPKTLNLTDEQREERRKRFAKVVGGNPEESTGNDEENMPFTDADEDLSYEEIADEIRFR